MGPNEFVCVHMEWNGSLLVLMRPYGLLCVFIGLYASL